MTDERSATDKAAAELGAIVEKHERLLREELAARFIEESQGILPSGTRASIVSAVFFPASRASVYMRDMRRQKKEPTSS